MKRWVARDGLVTYKGEQSIHQRGRVSWFKSRKWKKVKEVVTLVEIVKKDKSIKEVIESIILDNIEWKKIIHMTEPN